jgi:diphthamide synthase (EF-2-diphthine--ammonia ligase)
MGMDTGKLARQIISCGFNAKLSSIDSTQLDARFCGDEFDEDFLSSLPSQVDPCGEMGEFHTFVYDGPIFQHQPKVRFGDRDNSGRFTFLSMHVVR